jgi:hypothetical protein
MTMVAIMAGLLPIMWSTGTGSEITQRIAVPIIGGMMSSSADADRDPDNLRPGQRLPSASCGQTDAIDRNEIESTGASRMNESFSNLKGLEPNMQVKVITDCHDTYRVITADDKASGSAICGCQQSFQR